ncbi:MAG: hypothetical protein P4L40_25785 [Terracidiphilus sp.]|nr:hypothetical protein [Terracidiphilus sp.]
MKCFCEGSKGAARHIIVSARPGKKAADVKATNTPLCVLNTRSVSALAAYAMKHPARPADRAPVASDAEHRCVLSCTSVRGSGIVSFPW